MDLLESANPEASDPALRATGIGGSDAAAILGLNPYSSRFTVACEKVHGVCEKRTAAEEERLQLGKDLEPVVRRAFERKAGMCVLPGEAFRRHPEHPFIYANVDGLIPSAEIEHWTSVVPDEIRRTGSDGIFEGKTASGGAADAWGTPHDPRVPVTYWVQVQHYMLVTGLRWAGLGCLVDAARLEVRFVLRDDAWIDGVLLPALIEFWADVERGDVGAPVEPEDLDVLRAVVDEEAHDWGDRVAQLEARVAELRKAKAPKDEIAAVERQLLAVVNAGSVDLGDEETREVYRWAEAQRIAGETETEEKRLRLRVCELLGSASIGRLTTGELITWKTTSNGQRRLREPFKPKARGAKRT